ncbi:putative nuclease HARBI1 [Solenopsis invicta]|uniref:putative nuclease HARBI1 n=1 Tax=Solenopsis invicta TaxID=13686 RepID=UPI00193CC62D|nr:putative nuclease HARBI1 [Solenopsis invicta]
MDNEFINDSDDGFEDKNPEDRNLWRLAKRYIRDWENLTEFYEDVPFRKRYRFSKEAVIKTLLPLIVNRDLQGYSQATVSRIVVQVSKILASHLNEFINFSTEEKRRNNKNKFYEVANFPSVIGCIDCTHICIKNPEGNYGEAVAEPQREILDLVVRHPGSTHDAVIFDRSGLRCRFELGHLDEILLGDNGYACRRYLLTPVLRPETDAEL